VNGICPRTRGYVYGARGGQLRGEILARPTELKLLNRAGSDVRGSRTEDLIGDVDAVHFNSRSTAKTTTNRNR